MIRVKLEVYGFVDVEMSPEDYDALVSRLEDENEVDIGDIRGIDVASAMDTADLNVTDAMASKKKDPT